MAEFVQVVPDEIHAACHLPQQRRMLVSNANLEGFGVLHGNSVPQNRNNPRAAALHTLFIHGLNAGIFRTAWIGVPLVCR